MCPKLVFTDAERARPVDAVHLRQAGVFDGVTHRGAGAVRLHHANGAGVHTRHGQCRPIDVDLCGPRRRHDIHRVAVLVGGRAAQHSQDPVAIAQRIRQPLEQQHDGTLAGHEPVGGDVERMAASGRRQHPDGRTRTGLARFERHRGAARQGNVAFAVMQAATGQMHRDRPDEHAVSTVIAGPCSPIA